MEKNKWIRSSLDSDSNDGSLEVYMTDDEVLVRKSSVPSKELRFNYGEWEAFVLGANDNEFDIEP